MDKNGRYGSSYPPGFHVFKFLKDARIKYDWWKNICQGGVMLGKVLVRGICVEGNEEFMYIRNRIRKQEVLVVKELKILEILEDNNY